MSNSFNEIMVVDDTPANLKLLKEILQKNGYVVSLFRSAIDAINALKFSLPNVILMDINMPEMNGYEACRAIKQNPKYADIPIIFISALSQVADKVEAFRQGGVDYITKPFEFEEVTERIKTHIQLSKLRYEIGLINQGLEKRVEEQLDEITKTNKKLVIAQNATILALAKLSECRDTDTGMHLERVGFFCEIIAKKLKEDGIFEQIDDEYVRIIKLVAPLHDIGKVGIEDRILLKPGKLTPEEFEIMKTHTTLGAQTFLSIKEEMIDSPYVDMAHSVILYHHEKYNGSGYPEGLVGKNIPLCAQIMAVADVYDALRSKRPYKEPMTQEQASDIINEGKNSHFMPELVDAFNKCQQEINIIYTQLMEK